MGICQSSTNLKKAEEPQKLHIKSSMLVTTSKQTNEVNYEIMKILKQGTKGNTYQVQHKITSVLRTMKEIKNFSEILNERKSILEELDDIKKLEHPNIVRIYETQVVEDKLLIFGEYCKKGDIKSNIKVKLEEKFASIILRQVLSALTYAHKLGLTHGNLSDASVLFEEKPENSNYMCKLQGIGLAKFFKKAKYDELGMEIYDKGFITDRHYAAPELIKDSKKFLKCNDVWSAGILFYKLLIGKYPFEGKSEYIISQKILKIKIDEKSDDWNSLSNHSKELLKKMLQKDPKLRITAEEALNDTIFKKHGNLKHYVKQERVSVYMNNLKKFKPEMKIQTCAIGFIVDQLPNNNEHSELMKLFTSFDDNGDGEVSLDELKKGFKRIMKVDISDDIIEKFNTIDTDGSGMISYGEFLKAFMTKEKILTDSNLKYAFNYFDKDGSGEITLQELKDIFTSSDNQITEAMIDEFMGNADVNGDGKLVFAEFKSIMEKIFSK